MYIKKQKYTYKGNGGVTLKIFERVNGREKLLKHIGTTTDSTQLAELELHPPNSPQSLSKS